MATPIPCVAATPRGPLKKGDRHARNRKAGDWRLEGPRASLFQRPAREAGQTPSRIAGHLTTTTVSIRDQEFRVLRPVDPAGLCDDAEVRQRFDADEYMPYWAELWPAALLLSGYLLAHPCHDDAMALEIGCGLGLVGFAAASSGWRVLATDYDAEAVRVTTGSARLNHVCRFHAAVMDWRRPALGCRFDRILAADVLYERRWHAPVARLVADYLAPGGEALICDPGREIAKPFADEARNTGLVVRIEPIVGHDEAGNPIRGVLYRLKGLR